MRAAGLFLVLAACSDVDLVGLSKETVVERLTATAEVCAPPNLTLDVPYRVLFVIDTSLSNEWNDPTKRRVAAVRRRTGPVTPYTVIAEITSMRKIAARLTAAIVLSAPWVASRSAR